MRCDVGLEKGEYREYCLCIAVFCTITGLIVHKGTRAVLTGRSTVLGFDLACLALLSFEHLCVFGLHGAIILFAYILLFTF